MSAHGCWRSAARRKRSARCAEHRGWIQGRWVERAGERRRRFYRLTALGRKELAAHRSTWADFVHAIRRITELEHV